MMRRRSLLVLLLLPAAVLAQNPDVELSGGESLFAVSCSRCHGMRGHGGEGPSLARLVLPRAPDDDALSSVIQGGIPGTGMPGSFWFSESENRQVVAYVRSLGRTEKVEVAGDPNLGRELFETKGGCTTCHTVGGFGTNLGPDLTVVGSRRGPDYLRESIVDPTAALPTGLTVLAPGFSDFLMVHVETRDGAEVRGMRVNEDSYTIQLRDEAGRVHSFNKFELAELEKEFDQSLMPSYRGVFSDTELDDLVAYLTSLRGRS